MFRTGGNGQNESLCDIFGTTAIANDVWFDWKADFNGLCQIDTCSSTVDTKIAVYPAGGCPWNGTALACNDDSCDFQSMVTFLVNDGQNYTIQVGTFHHAPGGSGLLNIGPAADPPCPVMHDGVSENAVGLTDGGYMCWMVYVDCLLTIETIEVAYGSTFAPGGIANGSPVALAIWDDPTNDFDPTDAVLVTKVLATGGVMNEDTDTLNSYPMGGIAVTGGTWVAAVCTHTALETPASLDESQTGYGRNWIVGMSAASGLPFDYGNLTANDVPLRSTDLTFPGNYLLSVTGTPNSPEPGTGYCFGDPGSGTPCPCNNDNDGSVPGSGCDNGAFASGAQLTGSGVASLSSDTLVLTTTGLEPSNSGLYFQANNDLSPGYVWGDGLQCAGGQLRRLQVRFSDASGVSATTLVISTMAGNILAGDTKRYQCWYRTTTNPPCGPGVNDFNASNGYAVTWVP